MKKNLYILASVICVGILCTSFSYKLSCDNIEMRSATEEEYQAWLQQQTLEQAAQAAAKGKKLIVHGQIIQ